jgi:hypothetical protein
MLLVEQIEVATPAGFEPATFSFEGIGATNHFNAILTKGRFSRTLTAKDY